jgi:psp operon transcriptional activator
MAVSTIPDLPPLIGTAASFQTVLVQVSQLAPLDRPVLVVGERGTGKELIATRLALLSPRWDRPLMTVNCAALAETLLDSELFGHEAGAFTGAQRRRPSRFELADGGTLFLDEVAAASLSVQEKLLRVIEYGRFSRVGGNEVLSVDVRIIAATNVDLPSEAAAGRFRSDLLDRLAFDVVTVPPLIARAEDIPLLAEHFARAMARSLGWSGFPGFTPAAMAAMRAHPWPGNVRELKNAVERSLYRAEPGAPIDRIAFDPFASPWRPNSSSPLPRTRESRATDDAALGPRLHGDDESAEGSFTERVERLESSMLRDALTKSAFNQRRAAASLGLSYHQFRHYLKKHSLIGPNALSEQAGR